MDIKKYAGKAISALCTLMVLAQAPAQAEQSLEQAADDPTASLMSLQLSDWYTQSYHNIDNESANNFVLRSAMPFKIGEQSHIMRITAPIITSSPFQDSGLSDITLFDLATFDKDWGRWAVGAVALLPTGGEHRGAEKWGIGPAIGFVVHESHLLWGLFNQNIFTIAGEDNREDINVSILQPLLSLSIGKGWSMGVSEMTATYDWEQGEWSNLPLGFKVAKLHKFGKLPVQFSAQYEYNFADSALSTPEATVRLTAKLIFPSIL
ncbi:hypothetical protein FM037_07950 [Shewanella psychropiezotolerans]|uniref:Neuromedin U n=1 Tax=Shewanella psychropiezotolerans TaxID=2593655 RepID=A0ABX5WVQ4_9GAMM|nr:MULTISPECIES: hypothetical protein [Shewanella]MPY22519.1 hypothetical protein [Shewanella sp. YLB-07]QDO83168.1 hypothetical protein FM037_07950 [Shewanella psychropiezotolerans]